VTLALQKKRVHANAYKRDRQRRRKVIGQMRDLQPGRNPPPQRFRNWALNGSSELAQIISYPCER
jgi:hypothetical protein